MKKIEFQLKGRTLDKFLVNPEQKIRNRHFQIASVEKT